MFETSQLCHPLGAWSEIRSSTLAAWRALGSSFDIAPSTSSKVATPPTGRDPHCRQISYRHCHSLKPQGCSHMQVCCHSFSLSSSAREAATLIWTPAARVISMFLEPRSYADMSKILSSPPRRRLQTALSLSTTRPCRMPGPLVSSQTPTTSGKLALSGMRWSNTLT